MCRSIILVSFVILIIISTVSAEVPFGFLQAENNGTNIDSLMVKNYGAGTSVTETHTDNQQLEKNSEINTRTFGADCQTCSSGALEASISSNVIGKAHIVWQSIDMQQNGRDHHALLGRSVEDLVGVFSVQKFIQLWSNSTPGEVSVDWLPCS